MIKYGGVDSTENFEDIGHSSDATEMLEEYFIGKASFGKIKNGVLSRTDGLNSQ